MSILARTERPEKSILFLVLSKCPTLFPLLSDFPISKFPTILGTELLVWSPLLSHKQTYIHQDPRHTSDLSLSPIPTANATPPCTYKIVPVLISFLRQQQSVFLPFNINSSCSLIFNFSFQSAYVMSVGIGMYVSRVASSVVAKPSLLASKEIK